MAKPELLELTSKACYTQDPDGNSKEDQFLYVSTEDCGGGTFYVLETKRWAFDSLEELTKILDDFIKKTKQINDR